MAEVRWGGGWPVWRRYGRGITNRQLARVHGMHDIHTCSPPTSTIPPPPQLPTSQPATPLQFFHNGRRRRRSRKGREASCCKEAGVCSFEPTPDAKVVRGQAELTGSPQFEQMKKKGKKAGKGTLAAAASPTEKTAEEGAVSGEPGPEAMDEGKPDLEEERHEAADSYDDHPSFFLRHLRISFLSVYPYAEKHRPLPPTLNPHPLHHRRLPPGRRMHEQLHRLPDALPCLTIDVPP